MMRALLLLILLLPLTTCFVILNKKRSNTALQAVNRRQVLVQTSLVTSSLLSAQPSLADVTAKIASSAALRNLKSCQKKLQSLELYVAGDEYQALKLALREAPFADLRKSASTLVKGGQDGPSADNLVAGYDALKTTLEKMDSTASVALRGRKLGEGEFYSAYKGFDAALADFVTLAEEAAAIPVQYEEIPATEST